MAYMRVLFPGGKTMSTTFDSAQINQLLSEIRHEEAKAILRESSDPEAQAWLARLEQAYPTPLSADAPSTGFGFRSGELAADGSGFVVPRERGGCLTIWLVFALVANPLVALFYLANSSQLALATNALNLPPFITPAYILLA